MRTVSVLVLGTGFWASEWLRVLSETEGVVIAATAGGREADIPAGAPLAPDYRQYRDYREAIDGVDADALLVALPTRLHADAIRRGIDAGRHVLCEKPLAQNADQVAGLLAAASNRPDLVVMVNQNYRWRPWAQLVRSKITDGTVGEVAHIAVRFSQPEFLSGGRAELRNPLLDDMIIHHFDLIRFLSGRNAVEFYTREHRPFWSKFPGTPALDSIIGLDDGVQVSYSGTWAGRGGATLWDGDWAIQGENGLLTVINGHVQFHPDSGTFDATGKGSVAAPEPVPFDVPAPRYGDSRSSFEEFRRAIDQGDQAQTGIRDNCHSIGMVFAAEESIRLGRPVEVESWAGISTPASASSARSEGA